MSTQLPRVTPNAIEAVLMIQSVYRGFEVRKSRPLMKLRQIAQVGKHVVELRNHDGEKIRNTALEPQVESQNEEKTGELNNDHEVEAADPIHDMKLEQLVEQISDELNKDHVQAQYGSNDEVVRLDQENH
ncbi:unnamed protein product [Lactuca virosa]|uniref:Uncharacterized protein n=1 Tax=Lactuca virosa TaxID=75947 RepID=A0AAU9NVV7_9ASTR|nr:unnamed protein product [Lactuca virosa]